MDPLLVPPPPKGVPIPTENGWVDSLTEAPVLAPTAAEPNPFAMEEASRIDAPAAPAAPAVTPAAPGEAKLVAGGQEIAGLPAPVAPLPDLTKAAAPAPVAVQDGKPTGLAPAGGGGGGGGYSGPGRIAGTDPSNFGQSPTEQQWHPQVYEHLQQQGAYAVADQAVQAELAAKQAAVQAEAAQKFAVMLDEQKQRDAERSLWVQTALDKHEQHANELAKQEIDPDHFFTSKGTAGGVMAAIGFAASGLGDAILMAAGHSGGGRFLERAMSMVDRDIAVQKANIQLKRDALHTQMGVFAERYRAFGDERVAEASARASIFDWLASVTRAQQATAWEQTQQIAIGKLADQFSFQAEQYRNGIQIASEHAYDDAVARQQAAHAQAVAAFYAKQQAKVDEVNRELLKKNLSLFDRENMPAGGKFVTMTPDGQFAWSVQGEGGKESFVMPAGGFNTGMAGAPTLGLPPGLKPGSKEANAIMARSVGANWNGKEVNILARSDQMAGQLARAMTEGQNYKSAVEKMQEILEDPKLGPYDKYRLYTQAYQAAGGAYKQIYNLGAYDLGVQNLVAGALPTYSATWIGPAKEQLEAEVDTANRIMASAVQAWGMPGTLQQLGPLGSPSAYHQLGAKKVK